MVRAWLAAVTLAILATVSAPLVLAAQPWWVTAPSNVVPNADIPRWSVHDGLAVEGGVADHHTPSGVTLIAGSATDPGVAIAAGSNEVWRRDKMGQWSRSLLLLPQNLFNGPPRVTAIAAFSKPLSVSIYLATDGYGVLFTQDGGQTWVRDELGLPDHVLGLTADSRARALYASTDRGLWVHHLAVLPSPPAYNSTDLLTHWLLIALCTLAASAVGIARLNRIYR